LRLEVLTAFYVSAINIIFSGMHQFSISSTARRVHILAVAVKFRSSTYDRIPKRVKILEIFALVQVHN
jgi:hypothetical protein